MEEANTDNLLICRIQTRLCAVPVVHVVETMRPQAVEPIAGAPPFVRGLALVRGESLPVVDAARLLGVQDAPVGRFVTVKVGARRIALAVEAVLGVRAAALADGRAWPPLLQDAAAGVVETIGLLDEELLVVLRAAKLLPDAGPIEADAPGAVR